MVKRYQPKMGDILFVDFDPSLGQEQKEHRPALVVSIDAFSETSPFAWVVPITHGKQEYPTHVQLDHRTKTEGKIYVEQFMTIDYHRRSLQFVERIPKDLLEEVLLMIHELTTQRESG